MIRNEKQKKELVEKWLAQYQAKNGMTKKYFCFQNNISTKTLNKYISKTKYVVNSNEPTMIANAILNSNKIGQTSEQILDAKFHLIMKRLDAIAARLGIEL